MRRQGNSSFLVFGLFLLVTITARRRPYHVRVCGKKTFEYLAELCNHLYRESVPGGKLYDRCCLNVCTDEYLARFCLHTPLFMMPNMTRIQRPRNVTHCARDSDCLYWCGTTELDLDKFTVPKCLNNSRGEKDTCGCDVVWGKKIEPCRPAKCRESCRLFGESQIHQYKSYMIPPEYNASCNAVRRCECRLTRKVQGIRYADWALIQHEGEEMTIYYYVDNQ